MMKFNISLFRAILILENAQSPEDFARAFERAFNDYATDMSDIAMKHGIIEATIEEIKDEAGKTVSPNLSLEPKSFKFTSKSDLPIELVKPVESYIKSCYEVLMKDQPKKVMGSGASIASSTYFYRINGEVYLITQDTSSLSKKGMDSLKSIDPTWRPAFIELTRPFKGLEDDLKKIIYHAFYVIANVKEDHDLPKPYIIDYAGMSAAAIKSNAAIPARRVGFGDGGRRTINQVDQYAGTAQQPNIAYSPTLPDTRILRRESKVHSLQRNSDMRRLRRIIREVLETI